MNTKSDYVKTIKAILKDHQVVPDSIFEKVHKRGAVWNYRQGSLDWWKNKYEEVKQKYEGKVAPKPLPKARMHKNNAIAKIDKLKKDVKAMIAASPLKVEDFDLPSRGSLKEWERISKYIPVAIKRFERKVEKKAKKEKAAAKRKLQQEQKEEPLEIIEYQKFKNSAYEHHIYPTDAVRYDTIRFINKARPVIENHLIKILREFKNLRLKLYLSTTMTKDGQDGDISVTPSFWAKGGEIMNNITNKYQIPQIVDEALASAQDEMEKFINNGSGWRLENIQFISINTLATNPLNGAGYLELPPTVKKSKSCINIKNDDNKCFMWSILRHLHPVDKNAERVSSLAEYQNELKFEGIEFPVSIKDIDKFSQMNNIGVRVFTWEKSVLPVHKTKQYENMVNLLLIEDKDSDKNHYVLIKDFNRLLGHIKNKNTAIPCMNCYQLFGRQDLLDKHMEFGCLDHKEAFAELPKADKAFVQFSNYKKQLKHPVVIYADFEASTIPVDENKGANTTAYQKHKCVSYGYKIQSDYPQLNKPFKYFRAQTEDNNVVNHFLSSLMQEAKWISRIIQNCTPMQMTPEDEINFREAKDCHICGNELKNDRVRDHDHINGKYRGAAHDLCNKHFSLKKGYKIPVFFHNLRGYDSHFIIEEISNFCKKPSCIPNTMDKYIAFSTETFDFKDSAQFMMASLESLAQSVPKEDLKCMKQEFIDLPEAAFELLLQKGVYPYDYMNSVEKFNETELPSQADFYSKLNDEDISTQDYQRAHNVWNVFEMKTLGDYHDLYLKTDVCLLTDIFENFRKVCMKIYGLDPAHYYTAPSLSWDAMLKFTKVKIETFNDTQYNMQLFVEKGMRGGISSIMHRYAKANNKYMKNYNPEVKSSYITYQDANNLYGYAMSQNLPIGDYQWNEGRWDTESIMNIDTEADKGYIFEVDMDYPKELHDSHNDYPLAPETCEGELSPYMQRIKEEAGVTDCTVKKLIPTLRNKKNYVVHATNLKLYLSLGLKLTKVHRVLEFTQSKWLEAYIMKNTIERTKAKTDFEKDFYKLMNNSVFGKTMENVRRRIKVDLVANDEQALKLSKKCNVSNIKIFNEKLMAIQRKHDKVVFNKPTIVGMCILDLSKTLMYDYHYNVVKAKYGDRARLCFTDTDSLTYHIETEDLYKDMFEQKELYDFSGFSKDSPFHDSTNKKVIGKFKDETDGIPIVEFVGLRAKMYSNLLDDGKMKKTAKGVKKGFMKKNIKHENYKAAIFDKTQMRQTAQFNLIRARNHQLHSITVKKVGLCCFDDKRYVLDNNIHTLAHGHYRI